MKFRDKAPDVFSLKGCQFWEVGSRTIEGAWTPQSDYDVLVLSPENICADIDALGFRLESGGAHYDPSQGDFNSWRRGDVNVILTYDTSFAARFRKANSLCRFLRLKERGDRVAVFQSILYGNFPLFDEWEPPFIVDGESS